jgi:hypothetical protein
MMSCEEFQLHAGADPGALGWGKLLHLLLCRACARYWRSIRTLDHHIKKALALNLPPLGSQCTAAIDLRPCEVRHDTGER